MATLLTSSTSSKNHGDHNVTPERINELARGISGKMSKSLKEIDEINLQVRLLSFNAQIQAASAGDAGRTFAVVASEMGTLSSKTASVAETLASQTQADINELADISKRLASDVRGVRLSDLALNNIDLIDRNLYERSCDVRWWATDGSVVGALDGSVDPGFTSQRLGVILNAYTVYYDIVLCDTKGTVIANGRPNKFSSRGKSASDNEWFQSAMRTRSGDDFGFEGVHRSPLVGGKFILAYSCGVREGGQANGKLLGVLGILFNWESLAQTIVHNTPLTADEKPRTRVCIVDTQGRVLADTDGDPLGGSVDLSSRSAVFQSKKGFVLEGMAQSPTIFAHAASPGYETYRTDWHSLIIQRPTP